MKTIAIAGTFDSKGQEYLFIKETIDSLGLKTLTVNCGVFEIEFKPDISNEEVAKEVGHDIKEIAAKKDRGLATEVLCKGMKKIIPKLYAQGKFDGIISLGGSGGTSLIAPAMRALPIGVPKIIVSTVASGDVSEYVGTSDIIMYPSIVDVAGLNSISTKIFTNAASAICGMVKFEVEQEKIEKPLIAATMFGVTTPCVDTAREYLEKHGYEVLVFHATGTGGKTMESLIGSGFFEGVLDLTTTEWCDELVGGILNAGPNRLEAAAKYNVPQVVSVGAMDMVNFGAIDTIPVKFKERNLYKHNPSTTLMRTTIEENKQLGEIIADKLNMSKSLTTLMLPLKGVSMIDQEGQAFYGKEEDEMLFNTLKSNIDSDKVDIIEMNNNINDEEFALIAAKKLIELINESKTK
ncbi:Tm-1-like ATP-binding domain-containing protein [Metaclostridioides mangenotii]|uniref:Tm-1-like ATP-binding domain-containing protein n=1 Tax=Metaclostridioides mangenotii TaxID=1540 RepID=UPI0028E8902B|nr:Tm-1-like ATP-binding domain-containing protein [Clostridioides mangenotii]